MRAACGRVKGAKPSPCVECRKCVTTEAERTQSSLDVVTHFSDTRKVVHDLPVVYYNPDGGV